MSENILAAYSSTPSFALWDGESAVLRFTGKIDQDFTKTDSKGNEQVKSLQTKTVVLFS